MGERANQVSDSARPMPAMDATSESMGAAQVADGVDAAPLSMEGAGSSAASMGGMPGAASTPGTPSTSSDFRATNVGGGMEVATDGKGNEMIKEPGGGISLNVPGLPQAIWDEASQSWLGAQGHDLSRFTPPASWRPTQPASDRDTPGVDAPELPEGDWDKPAGDTPLVQ